MLMEITNPIADWLLPRRCFVCEVDLPRGSICEGCLCLCTSPDRMISRKQVLALFFYEFTIKQIMIGAKYNKKLYLLHLLYQLIEKKLASSLMIAEIQNFAPTVVTQVPSHVINRITRGVELQAVFAQMLARKLHIPFLPMLTRKRFFHRQALHQKKSDRFSLIQGSFKLRAGISCYPRVLLVDDVVTTGATLQSVEEILKPVTLKILPVAIAITP